MAVARASLPWARWPRRPRPLLERLCRTFGPRLLISYGFAGQRPSALRSRGTHRLAGVGRPMKVFTVAALA